MPGLALALEFSFSGRHNAVNALAALGAYAALGLPLDGAQAGAGAVRLSRWRGEELELPGGGTLINGFPDLVAAETGMPVHRAQSPLTCVAVGSGEALAHFDKLTASSRQWRPSYTPDWRTA